MLIDQQLVVLLFSVTSRNSVVKSFFVSARCRALLHLKSRRSGKRNLRYIFMESTSSMLSESRFR
jgi:hypothetical protein